MADNTTIDAGSGGDVIATDDIGGVKYQRVKISQGADGSATDVGIGGGTEATALRVTLASDSTGVLSVDDNGSTLSVDGTVTANLGATDTAALAAVETAVELLDDTVYTDGSGTPSKAIGVAGSDGTNPQIISTNTSGHVNIADGGNAITVDGTVAVTGVATAANQTTLIGHVDGIEALLTTIDADTSTLAAAVSTEMQVDVVGALPAGTNNIGDVDVLSVVPGTGATNLGKAEDAAHSSGDVGVMSLAVRLDSAASFADTDGDYAPLQLDSAGALRVTGGGGGTEYVVDAAAPAAPTGTASLMERDDALSALTEVEGDWTNMRANANGALWVKHDGTMTVDGSGVTQPVSGTVTANLSATDNAVLDAIEVDTTAIAGAVSGTEMQVDIVSAPTITVDLGVNNDVTVTSGNITADTELPAAAALADNTANPTVPAVGSFGMVYDGSTWDRAPGTSADGLLVNLGTNNDVTVSGVATAANQTTVIGHLDGVEGLLTTIDADTGTLAVTGGGTETGALRVTVANNSTGVLSVDDNGSSLTVDGTVAATQSGTWNVGSITTLPSIPAGNNNIGDVDIASGTVTTVTTLTGGGVAHDSADSGNPHKIGAKAGTSDQTAVATGDRTDLRADTLGHIVVRPYALHENLVSGATAAITNTTSTSVIAAAGAGVRNYVTSLLVTNSHSTVGTLVTITDGSGGTTLYAGYAAPVGGGFSITFPTPLRGSANTAIHAVCGTTGSNVYVSASGYKSAV